ncbi:MAG: zf-HC2 domain-containing protein [Solirubrobacterales bacterium]|nr:zf-HC2 domain-containing protein [Solirubrobacterales bacterium]MBV9941094.1 zf-HC2 domain-containing protein [Solirubrobacterales bacterium]
MSSFLAQARFRRDHQWAPEHMSAYLDEELAAQARGRMERHVGECPECGRLLADLRVILDGLHRLAAPSGGVDAARIAASVRLRLRGLAGGQ